MMESSKSCGQTHFYVCSYEKCGKYFSKQSRLIVHIRTHTGERPFVCTYDGCQKSYVRKNHLVRHEETAHQRKEVKVDKTFLCVFIGCSKPFASSCALTKHVKCSHMSAAIYKCSKAGCERTFHKRHQLRCHTYEHQGVLPFQCDFQNCGIRFRQSSHLQRHKKTHKERSCDHEGCSKTFEKWSQLRKHKAQVHRTEHKCDICGRTFPRPSVLQTHKKSHSEAVQMINCPHANCSRKYMELKNLKAHIRSFHEEECYKCNASDCNKIFTSKNKLLVHKKVHDPVIKHQFDRLYPNKGHRRKSVANKLVTHILQTDSPLPSDIAARTDESHSDEVKMIG